MLYDEETYFLSLSLLTCKHEVNKLQSLKAVKTAVYLKAETFCPKRKGQLQDMYSTTKKWNYSSHKGTQVTFELLQVSEQALKINYSKHSNSFLSHALSHFKLKLVRRVLKAFFSNRKQNNKDT